MGVPSAGLAAELSVVKLWFQSTTRSAYMWVHTLSLETSLEGVGTPPVTPSGC